LEESTDRVEMLERPRWRLVALKCTVTALWYQPAALGEVVAEPVTDGGSFDLHGGGARGSGLPEPSTER